MITLEIIDGPNHQTDESGWKHNAYTVRLLHEGRYMTTPWKQGLGITDDPEAPSVLESLCSDASTVENSSSFEEWASDLGYDPDSRSAEATYNAIVEQTNRLRDFLGEQFASVCATNWS